MPTGIFVVQNEWMNMYTQVFNEHKFLIDINI